jgi:hypothetical protein
MGLALLDVVKLQVRSNQIDAALGTAGENVNTTDRTAAMEAISIDQLEGGDRTGTLHAAKLIRADINRNSLGRWTAPLNFRTV